MYCEEEEEEEDDSLKKLCYQSGTSDMIFVKSFTPADFLKFRNLPGDIVLH